jgi:hypothetical protein
MRIDFEFTALFCDELCARRVVALRWMLLDNTAKQISFVSYRFVFFVSCARAIIMKFISDQHTLCLLHVFVLLCVFTRHEIDHYV